MTLPTSSIDSNGVKPTLRYNRRATAVLLLALITGPAVAWIGLVAAEILSLWWSKGYVPSWEEFWRRYLELLATTYVLGSPIALIAGLLVARIVRRDGRIRYLTTAGIAFLTPVVPLTMLGGPAGLLFGALYGVGAIFAALALQFLGEFFARHLLGVAA